MIRARNRKKDYQINECAFCSNKIEPDYKEAEVLGRFLTDRGNIISRSRSGTCSRHQRYLVQQIKRARHLALLPFLARVKK
ncbi:MAG TPA: 30S ribosomal protein S18 [Candidatus Bathyarchaeia archaeon]|nr:30S ribosomal protein S18 [Candidatus Bathyarchaeia archaeon]